MERELWPLLYHALQETCPYRKCLSLLKMPSWQSSSRGDTPFLEARGQRRYGGPPTKREDHYPRSSPPCQPHRTQERGPGDLALPVRRPRWFLSDWAEAIRDPGGRRRM